MKRILSTALCLCFLLSSGLITAAYGQSQSVVVSPSNTGTDWSTADTRPDGMVNFVSGPGTPPAGCGSLGMSLSLPTAKAQYFNYSYIGTRLEDITALNYWVYRSSASTNNPAQTISLNLEVDYNGDAPDGFTTLVYEPVYQQGGLGAMMTDTWQQWDAYNGGNAIWWSTRPIPGVCAFSCYVSWNDILAANPDAEILGGTGFNIGSGWAGTYRGFADALTIGVSGNNTVYNFEPSPDSDGDGQGDSCDNDDDNDGVPDAMDCDPADAKNNKVIVCHKGKEICVSQNAVQAHLDHGDNVGPCAMTASREGVNTETIIKQEGFTLSNYPNPLKGKTRIQYTIAQDSRVSIKLYDVMGRELVTLVNRFDKAGVYAIDYDASKLAGGIYYYRLSALSDKGQIVLTNNLTVTE